MACLARPLARGGSCRPGLAQSSAAQARRSHWSQTRAALHSTVGLTLLTGHEPEPEPDYCRNYVSYGPICMLHMYVSYGLCRRPTSGKHPALCGSIRDSCVWTLEPASDQCVWCPGDVSSKAVSVQSHSKPGTRQPCPYVLGGHVGCSGDLMGDFCPKDADLSLPFASFAASVGRRRSPFSALAFRCTLALHASQPALRF